MTLVSLPLHVWDREIDSRILLAALLADRGATVVFGHEQNISPLYSKIPHIFHFGCGRPIDDGLRCNSWYKPIVSNGGFVGLTYEEGINDMLHKENALWAFSGINDSSLSSLSRFYSWSSLDFSHLLEACPEQYRGLLQSKTTIASNARIEMLGELGRSYFSDQISSLRTLFGEFVLISDNFGIESFGTHSSADGAIGYSKVAGEGFIRDMREYWAEWYQNSSLIRDRFAAVIDELVSAHPNINFVVRPHPVADARYWHNKLKPRRNLFVFYKDTIYPWIFSANCVIHSGCTVGFEAELANIPAANISLLVDDSRRKGLSSYCSRSVPSSISELSDFVLKSSSSMALNSQQNNTLSLAANLATLNRDVYSKVASLGIDLPLLSGTRLG